MNIFNRSAAISRITRVFNANKLCLNYVIKFIRIINYARDSKYRQKKKIVYIFFIKLAIKISS